MDVLLLIPMVIVLVVLFFYLGWMFNSKIGKKSIASAEERAKQIISEAQKESNNTKREKLLEVKDEWYKKKVEFDTEINQKRQKIGNLEKQLNTREENIEKKFDLVIKKEKELIGAAMCVGIAVIGLFGPATNRLGLEQLNA